MNVIFLLLVVLMLPSCFSNFYFNTNLQVYPPNTNTNIPIAIAATDNNNALVVLAEGNTDYCIEYINYTPTNNSISARDLCSITNIGGLSCDDHVCYGISASSIIVVFDSQGNTVLEFGSGVFVRPILGITSVAIDSSTTLLYVVDGSARNISAWEFSSATNAVSYYPSFHWPTSTSDIVTLVASGPLLVVSYASNVVGVYNSGVFSTSFSAQPIDIAVDPNTNNIYIIDTTCNCITIHTSTGLDAGSFSYTFTNPQALYLDSCQLYVVDDGNLLVFSTMQLEVSQDGYVTCPDSSSDPYVQATTIGGVGPYQYLWTPPLTAPGYHTVTVTDSHSCQLSTSVNVLASSPMSITLATTPQICAASADGTAALTVSGGTPPYSYELSIPYHVLVNTTTSASSYDFFNLPRVNVIPFVVYHSGLNPLFIDKTWATENLTDPSMSHSGNSSLAWVPAEYQGVYFRCEYCIDVTRYAALSFWINAGPKGGQTITVQISDAAEKSPLKLDLLTQVLGISKLPLNTWVNGIVSLSSLSSSEIYTGIRFQDASGATSGQTLYLDDVELLPFAEVTDYALTITDSIGCTLQSSFYISAIPALNITVNKREPTCYGSSDGTVAVSAFGGTPPYSYTWLPLNVYTPALYNLSATTGVETYVVYDGTLAGAFTDWSWGGVLSLSDSFGGTSPCVSYQATGGDAGSVYWHCSGCIDTSLYSALEFSVNGGPTGGQQFQIALTTFYVAPQPTVPVGSVDLTTLAGIGTIPPNEWFQVRFDFADIPPGKYDGFWIQNVVNITQPVIYYANFNLIVKLSKRAIPVDFYSVVVQDANGCSAEIDKIAIVAPQPLSIRWSVQNVSCNGFSDGVANVVVSGGTPPYSYKWSHGDIGPTAVNLKVGTYYVTVVDSHGCLLVGPTIPILEPPKLVVSVSLQPPLCFNRTGIAFVSAQGGIAPYYYTFNSNTDFKPTGIPLPITVFLDSSDSATVTGNFAYSETTVHSGYMSMQLSRASSVTFSINKQVLASKYLMVQFWAVATPSFTGSLSVNITSTSGAVVGQTSISSIQTDTSQWTQIVCDINNSDTGAISTITVTASSTSGMVFIDDMIFVPRQDVLLPIVFGVDGVPPGYVAQLIGSPGLYSAEVYMGNGACYTTQSFNISTGPPPLSATTSFLWESNGNTANATVLATGGTPPYQYSWTTIGKTTAWVAGLSPEGSYPVSITDAYGCVAIQSIVIPNSALGNLQIITQDVVLNSILGAITGLCAIVCIASILLLVLKTEEFREKSPLFCGFIMGGVLVSYLAAVIVLFEPTNNLCITFPWLLGVAFTLVFGCLFLKTWRMWGILRAVQQLKRRALTNWYVLRLLSLYSAIEIAYLITWTVVDPPHAVLIPLVDGKSQQLACVSLKYGFTFWGVFLGYKILWMFFGAFMAIKTRGLFEEYKESSQIAFSIYNCMAVAIVSIPLGLVLRGISSATVIITLAAIMLVFTATLIALFGRIWLKIIFGEVDDSAISMRARAMTPHHAAHTLSTSITSVDDDSDSPRSRINTRGSNATKPLASRAT